MRQVPLGTTGLLVSPLGFGCWQLGGTGWGKVDARTVTEAVGCALDLGITLFDTAPVYGAGRSEELLARALGRRHGEVTVVSKAGLREERPGVFVHDHRPSSLEEQLLGTLRRLRRERLDLLLLHWPDPAVPLDDSAAVLERFRSEGKIHAWGLSNHSAEEAAPWADRGAVLMGPSNLLEAYAPEAVRPARELGLLLPRARERGWGVLVYDTLARGLLGCRHAPGAHFGKRDLRARDPRFQGQLHVELHARALALTAAWPGLSPAAAAVKSRLELPGVTAATVGFRSRAQVEDVARGAL